MADEYQSLTNSKSQKPKGYGAAVASTSSASTSKGAIISHKVIKSDSLTSLAIHYNSTVADIKRANKLWNNEALSFRDFIDIPVYIDQSSSNGHSSQEPSLGAQASDIHLTLNSGAANGKDISIDEFFDDFDKCVSLSSSKDSLHMRKSSKTSVPATLSEETTPVGADKTSMSSNDFFAQFDQSLSDLKRKVKHHSANSTE